MQPKLPVLANAMDEVKKLTDQLDRHFQNMQMRIEYLRAVALQGNPSDLRSFYNLLPERTETIVVVKQNCSRRR